MNTQVLCQLEPNVRTFFSDGHRVETNAAAFIGISKDKDPQLCIGLLDDTNLGTYIQLGYCLRPITAVRIMMILDKATAIFPSTIHRICYICSEKEKEQSQVAHHMQYLTWQIPGIKELREKVLQTHIDDEVINVILNTGVAVDVDELEHAVEAGIINQIEAVTHACEISRKKTDRLLQQEQLVDAIVSKPLPEEQSFSRFCDKFNIQYLFADPDDDFPAYWAMSTIDATLVRNDFYHHPALEIWCAEFPPDAKNTGHIGRPVLQLSDKRKVILSLAFYENDNMYGILHNLFNEMDSETLTLAEIATYNPKFIGHTLADDEYHSMADIDMGYYPI